MKNKANLSGLACILGVEDRPLVHSENTGNCEVVESVPLAEAAGRTTAGHTHRDALICLPNVRADKTMRNGSVPISLFSSY